MKEAVEEIKELKEMVNDLTEQLNIGMINQDEYLCSTKKIIRKKLFDVKIEIEFIMKDIKEIVNQVEETIGGDYDS